MVYTAKPIVLEVLEVNINQAVNKMNDWRPKGGG